MTQQEKDKAVAEIHAQIVEVKSQINKAHGVLVALKDKLRQAKSTPVEAAK